MHICTRKSKRFSRARVFPGGKWFKPLPGYCLGLHPEPSENRHCFGCHEGGENKMPVKDLIFDICLITRKFFPRVGWNFPVLAHIPAENGVKDRNQVFKWYSSNASLSQASINISSLRSLRFSVQNERMISPKESHPKKGWKNTLVRMFGISGASPETKKLPWERLAGIKTWKWPDVLYEDREVKNLGFYDPLEWMAGASSRA